jgi:hypothetical protein
MRYTWKIAGLLLSLAAVGWWCDSAARAQQGCATCGSGPSCGCNTCLPDVPTHHCPHPFCHTQEGPPCIHYKCGCPRPVCDPCNLPHYGYFQPCWKPWPYGPDWSHCPELPPAALVYPGPLPPHQTPPTSEPDYLPKSKPGVLPGTETLPPPLPGKLSLQSPVRY